MSETFNKATLELFYQDAESKEIQESSKLEARGNA